MQALVTSRGLVAMLLLGSSLAFADGDWPAKRGGIMNKGGETSFELVREGRDVIVYVEDHGEPVSTKGATGTIEIRKGASIDTRALAGVGENVLKASGVEYGTGDRVIIRAMLPNGTMLVGRFLIE